MQQRLYTILILLVSFFSKSVQAQTAYMGLTISTGSSTAELSDSLYVGPGYYQIDGTWEIYSSYILIDPSAIITGDGEIQFQNPGLWTGVSSPTHIDANNITSAIDVNINNLNDFGLELTNLTFPADLTTTYGWTEDGASSTMYVGRDVTLGVDGANIVLGSGVQGDLIFDADASISSFSPDRMVVTNNSILSHMVKQSYSGSFIFPVGISTGDYTPAEINNASGNTVYVSVQDYAASTSVEATADPGPGGLPADGIDRTWHIYGTGSGISTSITLQHNNATNQSGFDPSSQFVTQWGTTVPNTTGDFTVPFTMSSWQSNSQAAGVTGTLSALGSVSGSSMRSRTYASGIATSAGANQSYFSKSSDPFHPLPLQLLEFSVAREACSAVLNWQLAKPSQGSEVVLQHSIDGHNFSKLLSVSTSTDTKFHYEHANPGDGAHFYRLQLLSADGSISYSSVTSLRLSCNATLERPTISVYPNPTTDQLFVDGLPGDASMVVRLLSMDGKTLLEQKTDGVRTIVPTASLPQGSYVLQLLDGKEVKMNAKVEKQ